MADNFYTILENLGDGFYEVDLKGNLVFLNNSVAGMLGVNKDEILGKNFRDFIDEESSKVLNDFFSKVYESLESQKMIDIPLKKKNGERVYIEGSVCVHRDSVGNPKGFIGILRDVTEKIKLQDEVLRARKHEAIGIFAGGLAHDYNNALTAVIGNIALAKMDCDPDDHNLLEILNDAEKASMRVKELTQQLSSFARGGRPVKSFVRVKSLLEESIKSVLADFEGELRFNYTGNDLVYVDEIQVERGIGNVITNAKEAVNSKGIIEINIELLNIDQEFASEDITLHSGMFVIISIEDDGTGISEKERDKIFDPYFTTKEFASGMGLSLTYAVLKRNRGFIEADSGSLGGARFRIYLPVKQNDSNGIDVGMD